MADGDVGGPTRPAGPVSRLSAALGARWWIQVLLLFAGSRVVSTVILLAFASVQGATPWTAPQPDLASYSTIWDGVWYRYIAAAGYPLDIPRDADGFARENAWAFLPAYPALVRLLMAVTFLPYEVAAVVVSIACGAGAAVLFNRLMHRTLPHGALFATAVFCFAPTSVVLQLGYAESLQLLLVFLALHLLLERRYLLIVPVMAALAFVRPGALAVALVLAMHAIHRWVIRARDPFPPREMVALVVSGLATAALGFAWLFVAALVTGEPHAYIDTELAWRAAYVGHDDLMPFSPWLVGFQWWARFLGIDGAAAWIVGPAVLVVLLIAWAATLVSPAAKRLGVDLRLWLVSYSVYLLAVFFPQTSTFRLLMPLAPGLGMAALPRSRVYRGGLIVVCTVLQVIWVWRCWYVDGSDWTVP